jgi:hypothetical protein
MSRPSTVSRPLEAKLDLVVIHGWVEDDYADR